MMAEYLRRRRLSQVYSRNASSSVMTEAEGLRIKSKPRTKQFNSKDPSIIRHFSFEWRENSRSCNTRYLSSPFYKYTLFTTIRFLNSARPQALGRLCSQAWRQPPEEREVLRATGDWSCRRLELAGACRLAVHDGLEAEESLAMFVWIYSGGF